MRGHVTEAPPSRREAGTVAEWEALVTEAVGNAIEFWGFKRNHGRVWALLYLRDAALEAGELQRELGLSKGAVSMITRELEQWRVVRRVRVAASGNWSFVAETDLMAMIGRVVSVRESGEVGRIREDLAEAERCAREAGADPGEGERLASLRKLAVRTESALKLFLATSRLDLGGAVAALRGARPPSADRARGRKA